MTIRAVGQQNENRSLSTVVKSTAIGALAGYSAKYVWPVDRRECDIYPRKFVNLGRKVANENKIEEFDKFTKKSPAQEAFINMVNEDKGSKIKKSFSMENVSKKVAELGGEESAAGKELRGIIRDTTTFASKISRRVASAYNFILKFKRPAIPFIVTGAGVGFLAGFIHNVVKTDV